MKKQRGLIMAAMVPLLAGYIWGTLFVNLPEAGNRAVSAAVQTPSNDIVEIKTDTKVYQVPGTDATEQVLRTGTFWQVTDQAKARDGSTWYCLGNNQWVNATDTAEASVYQNPAPYWQIQTTQIQPTGTVGYDLYHGSEGVKTWLILRWLGLPTNYAQMSWQAVNMVKAIQKKWGQPETGVVDYQFWAKTGYPKDDWYNIDKYIAPLKTNANSNRSDHIEAMIHTAYQYLGKPYIVGAASGPWYGTDCSGLVMQALYGAGIDPLPSSSIRHAQPGYEWESRHLWANPQLKKVAFSDRQRGDLIFYYEPGTHIIWHVAIYLGNNQVIES